MRPSFHPRPWQQSDSSQDSASWDSKVRALEVEIAALKASQQATAPMPVAPTLPPPLIGIPDWAAQEALQFQSESAIAVRIGNITGLLLALKSALILPTCCCLAAVVRRLGTSR